MRGDLRHFLTGPRPSVNASADGAGRFPNATARALLGTILGSAPGFLLPFAIAAHMHVGRLTDAYAFALGSALVVSSVAVIVLQANVLPILQDGKASGRAVFLRRLRRACIEATVGTTGLYALWAAATIVYIGNQAGWTAGDVRVVTAIMAVLGLFVLASAINSVLAGGLNALGLFLTPAATQALRGLLPLAVIAATPRSPAGLLLVSSCVGIGELARTALLARQLRRGITSLAGGGGTESCETDPVLWRAALPHGLASVMAAASPMIDRGVAARLPPGSVTLIDLGEKVFQVPLTAITTSVILVAGAHWAALGNRDVAGLRVHFRRCMLRTAAIAAGCLACFAAIAGGLARVAGATLAGAPTGELILISLILMCGLPAACVINITTRLFTATRRTGLLPVLGICMLVTNLVFDVLGAKWLGAPGVALSSTIYRCVNAALFALIGRHLLAKGLRRGRRATAAAPAASTPADTSLSFLPGSLRVRTLPRSPSPRSEAPRP